MDYLIREKTAIIIIIQIYLSSPDVPQPEDLAHDGDDLDEHLNYDQPDHDPLQSHRMVRLHLLLKNGYIFNIIW